MVCLFDWLLSKLHFFNFCRFQEIAAFRVVCPSLRDVAFCSCVQFVEGCCSLYRLSSVCLLLGVFCSLCSLWLLVTGFVAGNAVFWRIML
ncbi:hypothetical protein Patl1_06918 [Pistacia atlantica]|uniref:Uncharacterized protein n=1 Tax=Pistacia atlantica TaxID=434234 RepID=A0ACC1AIS6_9ROSI|nr:hypothetical protein Patl1_06918 [Pistacia atlantica]